MWKIIDISTWDTLTTPQEQELHELVSKWIEITPELVNNILKNWTRELVTVWSDEFKQLILDYILFKLRKGKVDITIWATKGVNYLWELLFKFLYMKEDDELKQVMSNPYYIHWAWLWEFKKAWDASVYKYIFWEPSQREALSRNDFISFAMTWYMNHFWDEEFASSVWVLLPMVWWIARERDFFRRDFWLV